MRAPIAALLGCLAALALLGTGCASMPNQVEEDTGPPPAISSNHWTEVWSVNAPAAPGKGVDSPVFTAGGGWVLVRVLPEVPPRQDWSFSWDLRPAAYPKKVLPAEAQVHSRTVPYQWDGKSGLDYILRRVRKGRYYVNYLTDQACTIAVYVEK